MLETERKLAEREVEDNGSATIFKVIAYDDQMDEIEALAVGDNRIVGLYIVAGQVMALRKRSVNRLPTGCAAAVL